MPDWFFQLGNSVLFAGICLWTLGGAFFLSSSLYRYIRIFIIRDDIAVLDGMLQQWKSLAVKYYRVVKYVAKEAHTSGDSCNCVACYAWDNLTEADKKLSNNGKLKTRWRFW